MRILFLSALLSLAVTSRGADNKLQFYYEGGKYFYYAAYEPVSIVDSYHKTVQSTYTDKYGRVILRLPAGTYTCKIMYKRKEYAFRFIIYRQANIRKVYFGDGVKTYMRWG